MLVCVCVLSVWRVCVFSVWCEWREKSVNVYVCVCVCVLSVWCE